MKWYLFFTRREISYPFDIQEGEIVESISAVPFRGEKEPLKVVKMVVLTPRSLYKWWLRTRHLQEMR